MKYLIRDILKESKFEKLSFVEQIYYIDIYI